MSRRAQRPEPLVALFVAVTWAAVVFAVDGLISIVADREPIPAGIGPYYSVLAFAIAGVALWALLSGTARSRHPVWGALAAAAAVYLAFLLCALPWGLGLVTSQALSPFVLVATGVAAAAVVGTWAAFRRRWPGPPS